MVVSWSVCQVVSNHKRDALLLDESGVLGQPAIQGQGNWPQRQHPFGRKLAMCPPQQVVEEPSAAEVETPKSEVHANPLHLALGEAALLRGHDVFRGDAVLAV